ncbi:MAG: DUF4332 domain-containing protein [Gemmatimonadota bacterium]|nr:MAG: DUF4332 domain-containing protein [Gemmatimonadota bacterium]
MTGPVEVQSSNASRTTAGEAPRPDPWLIAVPAAAFLALAVAMMLRGVAPFANWFYISAWYPTILLLDASVAARRGSYYLLSRPRFATSLFAWSAVLWFFFELVNFRVANWYYVNLPPDLPIRWLGTTISFMTVLPVLFLAERLLAAGGIYERIRWPEFQVGQRLLRGVFATGVAFAALSLAWPRYFFPLIWGALTLLLEPLNYRRGPRRSLIGDLSAGRPARLLRYLTGGLAIGFIWELYNIESRSKWIYTVPGLENLKLFEMPLLGFGGFPVFAVDCFVVYQTLVMAGVAVPEEVVDRRSDINRTSRRLLPRRLMTATAALLFCTLVLLGMDRWNTDSVRPNLDSLWVLRPEDRSRLAVTEYGDVFKLANVSAREVASIVGASESEAAEWVDAARLVTLRGIGTANGRLLWGAGIRSVHELAAADPAELGMRLRQMSERPRVATPPKVRVWVQAAIREVQGRGTAAVDE